jgi:hypothetical protein
MTDATQQSAGGGIVQSYMHTAEIVERPVADRPLRDTVDAIADWLIVHLSGGCTGRRAAHPECRRTHCALAGKRRSAKRRGVHVVPLGRYPYKIFYRVANGTVQILHIHHTAQRPWDEQA